MIEKILLNRIFLLAAVFTAVAIFIYMAWKVIKAPYGKYEERYLESASGQLDQMFIFLPPETILYLKFIGAFLFGVLSFTFFAGVKFAIVRTFVTLTLGIIGYFLPDFILKYMQNKRLSTFDIQLLEALNTMSNSLKAGFSFPQALEQSVKESKAPYSQEMGLVIKESRLGTPLEKALQNLTERMPSEDLDLVVSSVALTRELGGNLTEIFDRLAHTIRERMKLKGKIDALTSQGKMQGWVVGLMPLVLGFLISFISPKMIDAMVNSLAGWIMIGMIIVFEIIGGLIIKKIVTIDV